MAKNAQKMYLLSLFVLFNAGIFHCSAQGGPDPWNYEENDLSNHKSVDDKNIPPDLRIYPKKEKKTSSPESARGLGEWFYRRILGIVLRGGEVKKNEDGSVDISLQMKLHKKEWDTLDEYLQSDAALSEDKLRRSLGLIEQSIYEPSIPTKIILAWSDYIRMFLYEYSTEITWSLVLTAVILLVFWLRRHMSHTNVVIVILVAMYAYEVLISYKEAEQKEVETFVAAINNCKWYFWSSKCEMPRPDPLVFFKHMNPVKIGVRMFTNIISEPFIILSGTLKTITRGITDELWYPFNTLLYAFLIFFFNILLLFFMIMILFNFILNIPFSFSVIGLVNVALKQRNRHVFNQSDNVGHNRNEAVQNTNQIQNTNQTNHAISAQTLDKLLDVFSKALNNPSRNRTHLPIQDMGINPQGQTSSSTNNKGLKRSASTGRLPNPSKFEMNTDMQITRRNVGFRIDGSGDAH